MSSFHIKPILLILVLLLSMTGCGAPVFENNSDVMARQAMFDLMKAQEAYRAEHGKYTTELGQLKKYDLEYHTGIVYLEIPSAGKSEYRAISLPSESSTARVFVYDTGKGGFYEADEVEVANYVLGALNFIRGEKEKQRTNILFAAILLGTLAIMGLRFAFNYNGKENNGVLTSYFFSLLPLGWAVAALNHLNNDIVFSQKIMTFSIAAIIASIVCLFLTSLWMRNKKLLTIPAPVLGLAGCTLFISIVSAGVVIYTLYKYHPL